MALSAESYPARFDVDPQFYDRDRLTTFFRVILAIPHLILVGGPVFVAGGFGAVFTWGSGEWSFSVGNDLGSSLGPFSNGVLGVVAIVVAIISWFAIVFTGRQPAGLWELTHFYLRWRARVVAYTALFRDEYPPFGDQPYPVTFEIDPAPLERDRGTVFFRIILGIPHFIVLFFLGIAFFVTTVIAWLAILVTREYPQGLYNFGVGVTRWALRVETYMLLMHDEYPPFSLE